MQNRPVSVGNYGKVVKEAVYVARKFDRNRRARERSCAWEPRQPRRPGQPTTRLHLEDLGGDSPGENVVDRDTASEIDIDRLRVLPTRTARVYLCEVESRDEVSGRETRLYQPWPSNGGEPWRVVTTSINLSS